MERRGPLAVFLGVTFGVTWAAWLPLVLAAQWGVGDPPAWLHWVGSIGPLCGGGAATAVEGGARGVGAWARRIYSLKFPPVWWLAALGIPVAYWLFGYGAARIATGEWPDPAGFGLTEKLPGLGAVGVAAVWLLTFGLGEESGWRGWLLAEVSRRGSVLRGSLVVAGVWMLWHLPAFFYNPTYMAMGGGIVGWALGLTAGSVFLSWMTARARWSIVPVLIWHAGFNLLTASDQAAGLIAAVISSLVMAQGVHAAVALSRRGTLVSRPADATI